MNDWVPGLRYLMSYDRDNKTEDIEQKWDFRTRQWVNFNRYVYAYNPSGEIDEETVYKWDTGLKTWVIQNRFRYAPEMTGLTMDPKNQ